MTCGWKYHIGKTELQKNSVFFFTHTQYLILHTFSINCVHSISHLAFQTDDTRPETLPL